MTNNDILRSLRYVLRLTDAKIAALIRLTGLEVSASAVSAYVKHDDEEGYVPCSDLTLAHFLNGIVLHKRGADPIRPLQPVEKRITNNLVCKKLRTAFQLKDDAIIAMVGGCGMTITKSELAAFFRADGHRNYRECGDQFLRYFLRALGSLAPATLGAAAFAKA